jgi:hypothetical protein
VRQHEYQCVVVAPEEQLQHPHLRKLADICFVVDRPVVVEKAMSRPVVTGTDVKDVATFVPGHEPDARKACIFLANFFEQRPSERVFQLPIVEAQEDFCIHEIGGRVLTR